MSKIPPRHNNDLFATVISDIKKYTGKDPLLPWLGGVKKIKESLPPQLVKEKLPRFLQKCAQTFLADSRYRNDKRYVRVWIQLMDFVDDPRALLKTMETNCIGTKLAIFYQAYALYYVKLKRFEEADKMYHLGVQNLAEPVGELQKSYEQFLLRMEQYKKKKTRHQEARTSVSAKATITEAKNLNEKLSAKAQKGISDAEVHFPSNNAGISCGSSENKEDRGTVGPRCSLKQPESVGNEPGTANRVYNEETVFKFVDTAIVGKTEAEDACHHGLVDPTINMKEAMNAINDMFREPIELGALHRKNSKKPKVTDQRISSGFEVFCDDDLDCGKNSQTQPKVTDQRISSGFEVFCDDDLDCGAPPSSSHFISSTKPAIFGKQHTKTQSPPQETFKIFVDDENDDECSDGIDDNNNENLFVFPRPNDLLNESNGGDVQSSPIRKFREDTVVGRFVGSAILDEPEVENACHHGLVDPTVNLKEAMDAINSMFGKPLDFAKTNRSKNPGKTADKKKSSAEFSILTDEDLEPQNPQHASSYSSNKVSSDSELFEPTINTKKAMDDINQMFGMPLDF